MTSGALIFYFYIKTRYKVIRARSLTLGPWVTTGVKSDTSTHKQRAGCKYSSNVVFRLGSRK